MSRQRGEIPEELGAARRELEEWRQTHKRRTRIPLEIWSAAVELARRHGVHKTARILRLDYARLKKQAATTAALSPIPAFAELQIGSMAECVVELEGARGKRIRIHLRGAGVPDLAAISQAFWGSKA